MRATCVGDVREMLTCDQIFIQPVHRRHILLLDRETPNIRIFDNPLLLRALRKGHVAVLQTPANQQLRRSALILAGERGNGRVLHSESPHKGSICLHHNPMFLAEGSNVCPRIEGVDLDLVHGGEDFGLRGQQFLQLRDS